MENSKIAKSFRVSRKNLDKILDGTLEYDFQIWDDECSNIEKKESVIEITDGKRKAYYEVQSLDNSSNNIADAVYGALMWGGQKITDYKFEFSYSVYAELKTQFAGKEAEIKKNGILVLGISLIKDINSYLAD